MRKRAAGVYHREARSGKYRLTFAEARAVCEYEGGRLATLQQLEAARKIGFHVCAAGWMAKGRVGYPIVKAGANCGFGKTGIVDYGIRLNRSERWDAYCYNPNGFVEMSCQMTSLAQLKLLNLKSIKTVLVEIAEFKSFMTVAS
ncbi:Tumor necrosis factor-inducible gene 6 protein [Lonchura striata]|uniref:Tumor necrosis factor-inducible gene 6 protein n=1 Tax=Lonchura striata TaxID=40157 RepID=A0A218UJY6_9PASE|nr:Tumor necrosis factor-inducible gene 6 protein [Lonchura striata domestica]